MSLENITPQPPSWHNSTRWPYGLVTRAIGFFSVTIYGVESRFEPPILKSGDIITNELPNG